MPQRLHMHIAMYRQSVAVQCYGCMQVAGFVQHYDGLAYATVKGAGHMVGQGKPAEALSLIDRFLQGDSL